MRMVRCNYFNCLYFFLAVRLLSVQSEQAMNDNNIQIEGNPKPASGPKRGEQRALKHGLTPLKKAVNTSVTGHGTSAQWQEKLLLSGARI